MLAAKKTLSFKVKDGMEREKEKVEEEGISSSADGERKKSSWKKGRERESPFLT